MKNIVGTNRHHDAAVCFLKDGQVDFFIEEERLNRFKHEGVSFEAFLHLRKITKIKKKVIQMLQKRIR